MKRTRPADGDDDAAPSLTTFALWPDLLPEMQEEVSTHLDVCSRHVLALTSTALWTRWGASKDYSRSIITFEGHETYVANWWAGIGTSDEHLRPHEYVRFFMGLAHRMDRALFATYVHKALGTPALGCTRAAIRKALICACLPDMFTWAQQTFDVFPLYELNSDATIQQLFLSRGLPSELVRMVPLVRSVSAVPLLWWNRHFIVNALKRNGTDFLLELVKQDADVRALIEDPRQFGCACERAALGRSERSITAFMSALLTLLPLYAVPPVTFEKVAARVCPVFIALGATLGDELRSVVTKLADLNPAFRLLLRVSAA